MPQSDNHRHLRGLVRTFAVCTQLTLKAAPQVPTIGRPYLTKNNIRRGVGFPSRCLEFTLCSPQGTGLARALRSAKRKVQAMQKNGADITRLFAKIPPRARECTGRGF